VPTLREVNLRDDIPPGRDPLDSIDFRQDTGPAAKPEGVAVTVISIPLEKITEFFKRLFRR
jgi:hypothetical protein